MGKRLFNIVVEGCCHGELDAIYSAIAELKKSVDLVLICGDFQALRNEQDMNCIAMPPKYRKLGDFHKYYTGEKVAPYPTIFIGGNHEASNYLWELFYGGWVAPNIYYLGAAGVVNFNGLKIGGLSGIYNHNHFHWHHLEKLPYDSSSERSIYHVRKFDAMKFLLLSQGLDVMLSHDWPARIEHHGDIKRLLRFKKHLAKDVDSGRLGSPPARSILEQVKPQHWFSAHLHVRYEALVKHNQREPQNNTNTKNNDEIDLNDIIEPTEDNDEIDLSEELLVEESTIPTTSLSCSETHFLALDKCIKGRHFIEHVEISIDVPNKRKRSLPEDTSPFELSYDPEWLAITRAFHKYFKTSARERVDELPQFNNLNPLKDSIAEELIWVNENIVDKHLLNIPNNFKVLTETPVNPTSQWIHSQPLEIRNNQTDDFCQLLQIDNRVFHS